MSRTTALTKSIKRRVGDLVITIDARGVTLRGFRRRKGRRFTWQQIAALDEPGTVCAAQDEAIGRRVLNDLHANPKPRTP